MHFNVIVAIMAANTTVMQVHFHNVVSECFPFIMSYTGKYNFDIKVWKVSINILWFTNFHAIWPLGSLITLLPTDLEFQVRFFALLYNFSTVSITSWYTRRGNFVFQWSLSIFCLVLPSEEAPAVGLFFLVEYHLIVLWTLCSCPLSLFCPLLPPSEPRQKSGKAQKLCPHSCTCN